MADGGQAVRTCEDRHVEHDEMVAPELEFFQDTTSRFDRALRVLGMIILHCARYVYPWGQIVVGGEEGIGLG